jgi:hypothetical protein
MNPKTALSFIQDYQKSLSKEKPDFKNPATLAEARTIADEILKIGLRFSHIVELENTTTSEDLKSTFSNLIHLAVKLARSKAAVMESTAYHSSIILPAYGENIRMMPRGTNDGEDINGEDFIVEKSKQLQWLFAGTESTYEIVIVDDMSKLDPVSSGQAATDVINNKHIPHVRVLFLEEGAKQEKSGDSLVAKSLVGVEFPKNTKKAGAVYYGVAKAIETYKLQVPHVIILTDCDLSVDIGQLGNLAKPIIDGTAVAVAGSRRLPQSILEIEAARNVRANAARYFREILLKGLLPKDTQCGAKAFSATALGDVIASGLQVLDFSFDIELLTKIAIRFGAQKIVPIAVAWFDSAELTTTDTSVHFNIMKAQLAIAKANKTGQGDVFEKAIAVSEHLTSDEEVWLQFLDQLKGDEVLLQKIQTFDTSALEDIPAVVN